MRARCSLPKELPSPTAECSIKQIMNPLHPNPHPLWPARHTGWHVACEETGFPKSLEPRRTHTKLHVGQLVIWKTLLEPQSGEGGWGVGAFLRSSELGDGTPVSLNRDQDTQCCHRTPWTCNLSPRHDIQHAGQSTANLFLRNSIHNVKFNHTHKSL